MQKNGSRSVLQAFEGVALLDAKSESTVLCPLFGAGQCSYEFYCDCDLKLSRCWIVISCMKTATVSEVSVRVARTSDREDLVRMRSSLWPDTSAEKHEREVIALLSGTAALTMPLVIFVAATSAGMAVGFLEVDLRSHADGCNPAQPSGYIEGWFVAEGYRQQGIGKKLVEAAEDWARAQGCVEIGSDALIDNETSQRAHEALGYEVVDRCVNYRKAL